MERSHYSQLELFSQSSADSPAAGPGSGTSLLNRLWKFEKTILIVIGFLVIGVIAFSLGVEKGKRKDLPTEDLSVTKTSQPAPQIQTERQRQIQKPKQQQLPAPPPRVTQPAAVTGGGYTIQIASFSNKKLAQETAQNLRKKGHVPLLFTKNSYTVVCVGNFPNKENAKPLLAELKRYYRDCYIRRL